MLLLKVKKLNPNQTESKPNEKSQWYEYKFQTDLMNIMSNDKYTQDKKKEEDDNQRQTSHNHQVKIFLLDIKTHVSNSTVMIIISID